MKIKSFYKLLELGVADLRAPRTKTPGSCEPPGDLGDVLG